MSAAHVLVWEFRVLPGCEQAFEEAYGPSGGWATLFQRSDGYLGTELLADAGSPGRYLTIDRWSSADAFARFKADHGAAYAELDDRYESLTESETSLGIWSTVGC